MAGAEAAPAPCSRRASELVVLRRVDFDKDVRRPETDAARRSTPVRSAGRRVVGLTQPRTRPSSRRTLITNDPPLVSEEVAGWHVIAQQAGDDRPLQARPERGTLASSSAYKEATDGLPAHAVASVYVDGTALTEALDRRIKTGTGPIPGFGRVSWLAGAITAEPAGSSVHAALKGDEIEVSDYKAELPARGADAGLAVRRRERPRRDPRRDQALPGADSAARLRREAARLGPARTTRSRSSAARRRCTCARWRKAPSTRSSSRWTTRIVPTRCSTG